MLFVSLLLSFLFYGNSISNGYSLDDELVTTTDKHHHENVEKGIGGIKAIFSSNYAIDGKQNYEYRPLVTYSYAIEWSLFSDSPNRPQISHFINVVLYGLCGFLIFFLVNQFYKGTSTWFSALITVLFIIHPIHSEVVNNIKNRDEILSLIFALLAAIQAFKWVDKQTWKHLLFGGIFITLSLLSKRSNLPFVVLIPLMLYFFRDFSIKKTGMVFGALLGGQLIFKFVKGLLLVEEKTRLFSYVENPLFQKGFAARIPVYFESNLFYVQKLVLPYPLNFYYGYNAVPIAGWKDWQFIIGAILMLIALFFAFKGLMKKNPISFAILFFFAAVGGAANLLSPMVGIVGERFVFTASFGFVFLVALLLVKAFKIKSDDTEFSSQKLLLPLAIVILPSFVFSINRNKDWQSKKSLYLADAIRNGNSAKMYSLLGTEYQEEAYKLQKESLYKNDEMMQKVDSALLFYEKSISIFKNYESNQNNRGAMYYTFYYDYLEAANSFKNSIELNKEYYEGMLNIGNSYAKISEAYMNVLLLYPSNKLAYDKVSAIDDAFRKNKLYKSLAIIRQFEVNAFEQLKKGLNANNVQNLIFNAQCLEKLDKRLLNLNFSVKIGEILNTALNTKTSPKVQALNYFRKACMEELALNTNLSIEEIASNLPELKKRYLDTAKIYFLKTYKVNPTFEAYYSSVNQFAYLLQDYPLLIQAQKQFLKSMKKPYNAPQYVQMANAYFSMGDKKKAKVNFDLGMKELNREIADLEKKTNRTAEDEGRLAALKNEVVRLNQFVASIKKNKAP